MHYRGALLRLLGECSLYSSWQGKVNLISGVVKCAFFAGILPYQVNISGRSGLKKFCLHHHHIANSVFQAGEVKELFGQKKITAEPDQLHQLKFAEFVSHATMAG